MCGVISSVLKIILSIISAAGFRKKKQKTKQNKTTNTEVQLVSIAAVFRLKMAAKETSSRENYYKFTSGRSTELPVKLWSIGGEFNRQTSRVSSDLMGHTSESVQTSGKPKK